MIYLRGRDNISHLLTLAMQLGVDVKMVDGRPTQFLGHEITIDPDKRPLTITPAEAQFLLRSDLWSLTLRGGEVTEVNGRPVIIQEEEVK